ncbi:hypothetical protein [Chitinophaga vietnamensis]|uniref:hypothetical protein n=1 Tax=Chitinophaga vietnamensis TaxID=2593957 RepID=UPI00117860E7|nr:hypothetical protein [Chitinophaga vietnamensis]
MGFAAIIIIRILFAACMVFIIGYIFGGFSKSPVLTGFSKAAAILVIFLFIGANVLLMRFAWQHHGWSRFGCHGADTVYKEQRIQQ